MKQPVVIVIPVYKPEMAAFERLALQQIQALFANIPTYFVGPAAVESHYLSSLPTAKFKAFEDHYFTSNQGYNELMVEDKFYAAFSDYEYLFLHQLDAYCFRNELSVWCAKGFDYIGPPCWTDQNRSNVLLNGGISLRKVSSIRRFLSIYRMFYPKNPMHEDQLFSCYFKRYWPLKYFIHLPNWEQAFGFGMELEPRAAFEYNGRQLPFCCHAFEKYDPAFWKDHIPGLGLALGLD